MNPLMCVRLQFGVDYFLNNTNQIKNQLEAQ